MRDEVVVGRSATIALQLYDEEARVESSTTVTVTVQRADGTEVLPAGTATTASGVGRYDRALTPAQLPEVDVLTATWSVTLDGQAQTRTTTVEVIGAHYFELAELRAMPGMGDTGRYTTRKLVEARTKAQDEIERQVGAAFVERYGTATLTGGGRPTLLLRPYVRRILGVTVGGLAYGEDAIAALVPDPLGALRRTYGVFGVPGVYNDVVVRFVHAWSDQPPVDIHDIALELARHHALGWRSFIPDEPVEADDLGRETPSGEALDRQQAQDRISDVITSWRRRLTGYRRASSLSVA